MLSSGGARQTTEAQEIRNDSATLGASANVIYTGDMNSQLNESGYPGYNGLVVTTIPAIGQGIDPGSTTLDTESATNLRYIDDHQLVTAPVYNGTNNFKIITSSYTVVGNNGSVSGNVTNSGNTALTSLGLSSGSSSAILADLTTATDHLPVVADYSFTPASTPATISLGSVINARIMAGGTGILGATVSNSAASGADNLNYTLSAAVNGGNATLGTVTPGSGALPPAQTRPTRSPPRRPTWESTRSPSLPPIPMRPTLRNRSTPR